MKPKFLNLFMKKLTRGRVVPTISASVSWLILAMIGSGLLLSIVRQQKEKPREALFAGVEQLIDQVGFDTTVACHQMGHKLLGERHLGTEDADQGGLLHPHDRRFSHRRGRRKAQRLPDQASLGKKVARFKDGKDGLLSMVRSDGKFDLAFLDVKNRVGRLSLRKDRYSLLILGNGSSAIRRGEKNVCVKKFLCLLGHVERNLAALWVLAYA